MEMFSGECWRTETTYPSRERSIFRSYSRLKKRPCSLQFISCATTKKSHSQNTKNMTNYLGKSTRIRSWSRHTRTSRVSKANLVKMRLSSVAGTMVGVQWLRIETLYESRMQPAKRRPGEG